jgi:hypothetical protein
LKFINFLLANFLAPNSGGPLAPSGSFCSRSLKMNQQQTYRGSSLYVEWMRDMLIYNNLFSSK